MPRLSRGGAEVTGDRSSGIGVMGLTGGFLAVFSLLMSKVFPELPWHLVFPALLGGGLGWTRGLLDGSLSRALLGLSVGGTAGVLVGGGLVGNALLACGLFGGMLGTVPLLEERNPRLLISSMLTTGLLATLGAAAASMLLLTPGLPEIVSLGLAGAVFGTAIGTSQVLRLRPRDLLLRRFQRLRDRARGELAQVIEAVMREYVKLEQYLRGRSALGVNERRRLRGQIGQLTDRILDTAERECFLEHELQRVRPLDIDQRSAEVRRRIDGACDDAVRQQYVEALENLGQQSRHYTDLERSREKLMSRLTNFLTSMQNLYLSLINLETTEQDGLPEADEELASRIRSVGEDVAELRQVADEMSLRRRLEELPERVRDGQAGAQGPPGAGT